MINFSSTSTSNRTSSCRRGRRGCMIGVDVLINEIPHDPRHLGVPSGVSKTISEPMLRSAQTVDLTCVKISTIYEWTDSSFHLTLIT
jgi:hypothetical protein